MNKNKLIIKRYRKKSPDSNIFLRLNRAEFGQKFGITIDEDKFYPDIESLISKLKKTLKLSKKSQIVLGLGAESLIKEIFVWQYMKKKRQNVLIYNPNYYMYSHYTKLFNFKLFKFNLDLNSSIELNSKNIIESLKKNKISIYCMINPSAPVEKYLNKQEAVKVLEFCKKNNIFVIIDEVYKNFFDKEFFDLVYRYNVVIIRSFSKTIGFPGLRVGYLLCSNKIYKELDSFRLSVELPSYAVAKAKKILKNVSIIHSNEKKIKNASAYARKEMRNKGYRTFNKNINSIVVDLKNLKLKNNILKKLKKNKILISEIMLGRPKYCISFVTTNIYNLKKLFKYF